jgi:caa(3)-type oxidase subunit IV
MANPASHSHEHAHGGEHHGEHHHVEYVKIYFVLLALLIVSVAGPFIGDALKMHWITLVTAFGIAVVKAYMVAANFMHLKFEKKYVSYLMFTALAFMFLFYAGVSPDVMKHRGRNWDNVAAKQETERAQKAHAAQGEHGEHGAEPARR